VPPEADPPRYEAFLVLPDSTSHWVVAVVSDATRAKARRFACLDDATGAARLADGLNSRLLGRPNHQARLRAALDGLPLTVHAAVRHVPTGPPDGSDPLADHLPGDPIDGLLLFPTTSDGPSTITPRTAYAVAFAAEDIGDLCHEGAQAIDAQTARRFLPRLPVLIRRQRPEQLLSVAADLDRIAASLRAGVLPEIRTLANRLAMRVAIEHAERLLAEDPDILSDGSRLLPTSPHDYDFDGLSRHLPEGTVTRRSTCSTSTATTR
jgi:hypothetical protein